MWPNRTSPLKRRILFGTLVVIVVVVNLPIILVILNSFQTTDELIGGRAIIPPHPTFANYHYLAARTSFLTFLANSFIVSGGAMLGSLVAAALAGYALSRFRGRLLTLHARTLFVVQMFPIILALIPLFILFRTLGLINNPLSVIIVYTVTQLPFATWMARSFFDTIPRELEEAAQVDGCSKFRAFLQIVIPLSGPG